MSKERPMKESGIPWIGEIPEGWEVTRLKNQIIINNGAEYKTIQSDEGYPVIGSGGIFAYAKDYMYDGEVVLLGRKGTIDRPLYFSGKFWAVDTMFYSTPKSNVNVKFHYYACTQIPFNMYSTQTALPSMTQADLKEHLISVPPLPEQTAIANFLDDKCGKIDALIENEEKTIIELKEYKKSIVQNAIEKNCSHWETKRFITVFSLGKGLNITKANLQDEGVFVVSYGEIHSKYGRELNPGIHTLKYVSKDYLETDKNCLLKYGDFIFADTSEDIEGAGNFTFLNSKNQVFAGYHTIIARPKIEVDFLFLSFLCDSYNFREQIQSQVTGIKVFSITKGLLKNVNLWLPPLPEQKSIADYLDKKTKEVDSLIAIKQQKIAELKEYKKSIIYEYVTGKKEV